MGSAEADRPRPPVVVWGAGGHAKVVADVIRCAGGFEIVGFLDARDPGRRGEPFAGAKILGGPEVLADLRASGTRHAIVAIGDCEARLAAAGVARGAGLELASAIHPRAVVAAGVEVGAGTVVMANAVVNPGAELGEAVIVNTAATVDHDCRLDDGVHIAPGAHLAGGVTVGRGTWVGIGAAVRDGIRIGAATVVGAGAVVVADVPSRVVAVGVPARVLRTVDNNLTVERITR